MTNTITDSMRIATARFHRRAAAAFRAVGKTDDADAAERAAATLTGAATRRITYYAKALNPDGRVAQLLVLREHGPDGRLISASSRWTGVTYRNDREANRDLERLNCGR